MVFNYVLGLENKGYGILKGFGWGGGGLGKLEGWEEENVNIFKEDWKGKWWVELDDEI